MTDLTTQHDITTYSDTLSSAAHLGMEVPAPVFTTAYEAVIDNGEWDEDLGIYQTQEAAYIAIRNYVIELHDETEHGAPWAEDLDDPRDPQSWKAARTAWIAARTDIEIIETLIEKSKYWTNQVKIERTPERLV